MTRAAARPYPWLGAEGEAEKSASQDWRGRLSGWLPALSIECFLQNPGWGQIEEAESSTLEKNPNLMANTSPTLKGALCPKDTTQVPGSPQPKGGHRALASGLQWGWGTHGYCTHPQKDVGALPATRTHGNKLSLSRMEGTPR